TIPTTWATWTPTSPPGCGRRTSPSAWPPAGSPSSKCSAGCARRATATSFTSSRPCRTSSATPTSLIACTNCLRASGEPTTTSSAGSGDYHVRVGEAPRAREQYERALERCRHLSEQEPANTAWQRDLSVSNSKLGAVLLAQGNA